MPSSRAIAFILSLSAFTAHGQVNMEINKSLWKQKYGVLDAQINEQGAYAGWLSQDADGDGVLNRDELAAGTNPFPKLPTDPHFRTPAVTDQAETLSLSFPTVAGKFYQAESSDELAAWLAGSLPGTAGDGSTKTLVVPKGAHHFFRVRVSDRASQGDQVSDWAKIQLGLSPSAPLSGQTSYTHTSLAASLASQNEVTLGAVIASGTLPPDAATAGDAAVIRVSRTGSIVPAAITVPLVSSGTATAGVDYTALPASVTFPAGVNSIDLKVTPLYNAGRTSPVTVIVTASAPDAATASGNYRLGTPAMGAVTLYPSGAAAGTGLTAQYYNGSNATYTNIQNFGGQAMTYAYIRNTGSTTAGVATLTYTGTPATPITEGSQVRLQFSSGNLNIAAFNTPRTYTVIAPVTATSFKVNITGTNLPGNGSGSLSFGNFHTPVVGLEPNLDIFYYFGSPNGVTTVGADNHSVRWETYLSPAAGNYTFQLDADDKAQVFLYLDGNTGTPTRILENGWDGAATGGFKQSAAIPLAAGAAGSRYRMVVEFAETTGASKCRLQWKLNNGAFANIPPANAFRDNTSATTGWSANYFNNATLTGPAVTTQFETAITVNNNGDWGIGTPDPQIFHNTFSVRWTGQVLPQYSQKYYFVARSDDGVRLWVNDQLIVDRWPGGGATDTTGTIDLKAGVFYDIVMEYYEGTGSAEAHLSWYSEDQAKQIIPTSRLFPAPVAGLPRDVPPVLAAPAITSPTNAVAVMNAGSPFSMNLTSSNSGVITAEGLPSWLTLVNGVLSGTPPGPGIYQFTITTTNEAGSSSVIMTIEVLAGEGTLTRETWTSGVTGPLLSDVPWHAAPASTDTVATAEDNGTGYGANTGERLRGYFIAPSTGNYYFWIAASNTAELWISNDAEPVNKVLRASVAGPAGTGPKVWNAQPKQKSHWLSLVGGRRYYIEALHNTGASGASNHLAVGWFADPTGNTEPGAGAITVLPSYLISPWDNPPTTNTPGTLYVTNLQGVEGLGNITATGGAFLRVNGGGAVLQLNHAGLTSGIISRKIYNADDEVIFDVGAQEKNFPALKTSDGGYSLSLSGSDLSDLNNAGVYIKIATVNHPDGEITGTFGKVDGSQLAPSPPSYPSWPDQHASSDAANARFLTQATFGPSPDHLLYVKSNGYRAWIENQFGIPSTKNVPYILANLTNDPQNPYTSTLLYNSWWRNSVTAPDQLRQRAAFALSEIFVVSNTGPLDNNARALGDYYDTLLDSSFGNFRDILKEVTLSPAMGVYLDMRANSLGNIANGTHPNENYAREILQLFSAGLYRVWPDGTLVLDSKGLAVPTYDQSVITGFARVFTGWNWGQALQGTGRLPTNFSPATNYLDPMILVPARHELGSKILLDNVVLPPAVVTNAADTSTDPASTYTVQSVDPALGSGNLITTTITNRYDLNGVRDLEQSIDNIMNNPAVAPYICRQLIQRLVTSHPKPAYVHRVVRAFNGERNVDGVATGIKGDMKEVFRAILLDYEARSATAAADPMFGKQREPVLRITGPARTFPAAPIPGSTYRQTGLNQILVTTPMPHRLINSDTIQLADFTDGGGSAGKVPATASYTISNVTVTYSLAGPTGIATITAPGFQAGDTVSIQFVAGLLGSHATFKTLRDYTVVSATATTFTVNIGNTTIANVSNTSNGALLARNFTVNALNYVSGAYTSTANSVVITSGGFVAGHQAYVRFSSGGLAGGAFDGAYTITAATSTTFTITLSSSPANTTGTALIPRFAGGYNVVASGSSSNIDIYCSGAHNLAPGDNVYVNFLVTNNGSSGPAPDGVYTVSEIRTPNVFRVNVGTLYNTGNQSSNGMLAYPLSVPVWNRSGTLTLNFTTWNIGGTGNDLGQTPINSPTVFNFFYPDYRFPGPTAQAGMTTPEFQLTNDSSIMNLTNAITTSILSASNTNGYTSFKNNGAIMSDFSPYMSESQTSAAGIPGLVDTLATVMIGGELHPQARTTIINYVSNTATGYFPFSSPPTNTQMRDRVRAIIHLIATSAEYAIQK